MAPRHPFLAPKPLFLVHVLFEGGIWIIFYFAYWPLAKFGSFFLWVIASPHTWQKLKKKTMGGISRRSIFILGKNNYFEVGIIKRVFSKTVLLHIRNCTLWIHLVYNECTNDGYYLIWFCIDILLLWTPIYDLDKPHLLLLKTFETHIHVLFL
jgi:hypothetical protein